MLQGSIALLSTAMINIFPTDSLKKSCQGGTALIQDGIPSPLFESRNKIPTDPL